MTWQCAGIRWADGRPAIGWYGPGGAERGSPLVRGQALAFVARGERRCLGVRRAGRRTPCPRGAGVPGRAGNAQCPECARLDRSFSVAADTNAADPRTYRVYLAWFGPGMVKVGITAEERGAVRLLEQGAVTWAWLGRGPLMATRRTEELLRAALGVPDRIAYSRKRAARAGLPPAPERAREVAELHARATALIGWPESLERLGCEVTDHAAPFDLADLPVPTWGLAQLLPGAAVVGRLAGAAGPDLHFTDGLVVDTRLLAGWELAPAPRGAVTDAPLVDIAPSAPPAEQDGLF
ncbi:DUF2797 domain-containing protein [Streptomyces sp. RerS4]|uniref:DUF2797 domain-containing protein n=1 Tax=Streptomyces sp. RerS4 TaxID=2942449 RepID=UPI00201BE3BC|nr:DUF2797 domain-containing protein [Streptomyces sp. RerS4]UQX02099.1 DUF2797 domain-containing protein [Streptomyces sp. RerS4]